MKKVILYFLCLSLLCPLLTCFNFAQASNPTGDLNQNGDIDSNDTLLFRASYLGLDGAPSPEAVLAACDLNQNGRADSNDYILMRLAILHGGEDEEELVTYQNPVLTSASPGAWENQGLGDPFVMRHNGVYYLYITGYTVRCFSSTDLINWTYEGVCCDLPTARNAYAPEVFYYNGYFYMYASPSGNGHYVYRSSSPTGPFEAITDNVGMRIDGSVFIDNDGKWYFYTAGDSNILYYEMTSPSTFTGGTPLTNVTVNGVWTEGAMTVYHDGYYYITYTGNHFLSSSYRILYNTSAHSPISFGNNAQTEPPLLVNTTSEMQGIGHSSTVKGPDLDSYYIVYHSLVDASGNRNMNIDRIVFNGNSMTVQGPTVTPQAVPSMPDVYAYMNTNTVPAAWSLQGALANGSSLSLTQGSSVLSDYAFDGNFTAEYNMASMAQDGIAGGLFSYTDQNNYGALLLDMASQEMIIRFVQDGQATETRVPMIRSFSENVRNDCVQALQVEKKGNTYTFYLNDRLLHTESSALPSGKIGYLTEKGTASFGFIGGTGAVGGQGNADTPKTVSETNGFIDAREYTEGQFDTVSKNGKIFVKTAAQDMLSYTVLASESGSYDFMYSYYSGAAARMEIYIDGVLAKEFTLKSSYNLKSEVIRDIPMTKGVHTVSIKTLSGIPAFASFELLWHEAVAETAIDFSAPDDPVYTDGPWTVRDGALCFDDATTGGKRYWGDRNWGDYTVEADLLYDSTQNNAINVRATNPTSRSLLTEHPDPLYSGDSVIGYTVGFVDGTVYIGKQFFAYSHLAGASVSLTNGTVYRVKVECRGATIKVYVNNSIVLTYTDPTPLLQGMVGVRAWFGTAKFDNIKITPLS